MFLGLKTGVVEAAEGPPSAAKAQRFHEAAPQITLTNHLISTVSFSINEGLFQHYTDQQKEWIIDSAQAAVDWTYAQSKSETQAVLEQMKSEGATLHSIDVAPLQ